MIDIMESSPIAQFAIGSDHRITHWNHACELMTGRSAREMVGTDRQWEPFYPDKRSMLADFIVEGDFGGIIKAYVGKRVGKSMIVPNAWEATDSFEDIGGQPRHIAFLAAPLFDNDKSMVGAVETLQDITEQRKFEQALIHSEEGYRILAENVPDGVALMQDISLVLVNHAFADMFGYTNPEELIGKRADDLIDLEYRERFRTSIDAIQSGASIEKVLRWPALTREGREFWVEGHPNPMKWENRPAVLSTVVDITETRFKEIAIEEETQRLRRENLQLKSSIKDRYKLGDIVGKSPAMQEIYELILRAASTNANVILYGESGTGKELAAKAIHDMSNRCDKAFVPVNCSAIPETLFESEFFGYRKGAFTGANADKPGFLDLADGGTLFLDEVGDLPPNMQVKLLRAIEGIGYTPVGDTRARTSDFRIISATNKNLTDQTAKGLMREDFFYRIHVVPLRLPALRDRKEDIAFLADYFLQKFGHGRKLPTMPGRAMEALYAYDWPGNVRELQNVVHRYLTVGRLDFVYPDRAPINGRAGDRRQASGGLRSAVEELEKDMISSALNQAGWNKSKAAIILGIPRKTLFRKMKKAGLI